ncbi:hypothetical protein ACOSP7_004042 [Xanthoceras sorbifolium]
MGSRKASLLPVLFIFTILFTSTTTIQLSAALRPLHDNQSLKKYFQNLQRAPVPPIGSNDPWPPAATVVDFSVAVSPKDKNNNH